MKNQQNGASDAELVSLSKIDPENFGFIMERYQIPLFHYIRRITQYPKEDVEDILQEVFIKIFRKLNEYDEQLKFSSWAYRIAHNHVIDTFRKSNARPKTDGFDESEMAKLLKSRMDEEEKMEMKDCAEKVKECIGDMPLKYREVLVLRFVEEKSYEEMMDILKKPKGSVATLVSRGREILSKNMKRKGIGCF
ncbi:MAG: RNA polymerase sigma factor [Candidatus Moranbacteria bacterium]|nr:RNA polymerase sigma factor [Candidatus Moranbacteria bacterium]